MQSQSYQKSNLPQKMFYSPKQVTIFTVTKPQTCLHYWHTFSWQKRSDFSISSGLEAIRSQEQLNIAKCEQKWQSKQIPNKQILHGVFSIKTIETHKTGIFQITAYEHAWKRYGHKNS